MAFSILNFRQFTYRILQDDEYESTFKSCVEFMLIFLIIANVTAVIASSVEHLYQTHQVYFDYFEVFSISVFIAEYLLRIWCIVENEAETPNLKQRLRWAKSPIALVDLIAILPAILFMFADLRFLRTLRLFRLLKLTRYFASLRILLIVLKRERGSFQAVVFILLLMLVTAASGIYITENQAQPEEFASIPQSMWWAVVTLTTVGYGDVTPITIPGKIFGAIITILGVGFAALPAGILASGLANELDQRREALEQKFRELLLEADFDLIHNQNEVEKLRKELGLSQDVAQSIELQVIREINLNKRERELRKKNFCPHCGESLH